MGVIMDTDLFGGDEKVLELVMVVQPYACTKN